MLRITNQAEMCYVFDDLRVDGAQLRSVPPLQRSPLAAPAADRASALRADPITAVAIAISKKLLEALGAKIIEELFPPQPPSYFDQVYETITRIVRKELQQQTINEVKGSIDGTVAWLRYDYTQAKAQGEEPNELKRGLRAQSSDMHKLIRTLMLPDYRMPALSVFLLAVGIHLVILQEMALLSQDTMQHAGLDALAGAGASLTEEYATHAINTFAELLTARNRLVTVTTKEQCFHQVRPPDVVCSYYWCWVDAFSGAGGTYYPKDKDDKGKADAERDMRSHLAQVEKELADALKNPHEFASIWRQIG